MRRPIELLLRLLPLTVALASLAAPGCVRRYVEPAPSEPHALVKFRFLHHVTFSSILDESLRLDGYDVPVPPGIPTEPRLRAVRVRPALSSYRFAVDYHHFERRSRLETYTESYSCGTYSAPQTCTRLATRTVYYDERVTDAACEARSSHVPLAGAIYIVQFDFYGHEGCAASCFRQIAEPGGEFTLLPCGAAEPPVAPTAGGEAPQIITSLPAPEPGRTDDAPAPTSGAESLPAPPETGGPPVPPPETRSGRSREGADGLAPPRR